MSIEILSDGKNYVNKNGDVLPVDQSNGDIPIPDYSELVKKYLLTSESDGTKGGGEVGSISSVNLADRAIAINGIMHVFNLQNRNRGANSKEGIQDIKKRYFDSDSLLRNMDEKERVALEDYEKHFNTLAAVDKLRETGFSENDIQSEKDLLRADLEHYYGPGNAYAPDRKKLVKKVQPPETKRGTKKKRS
jgi:hypothetical protein